VADKEPLRTKSRLPFGDSIRPGIFQAHTGMGGWLYVFAALGMAGLALYQVRSAGLELTNFRVIAPALAAAWLAFRAVMLFAAQYSARREAEEETQEESKDQ
jgi:hypothetical protein